AGWTRAQARAVAEMLPPGPGTQADAAERLGVTRTAVTQALAAAGFRALSDAIAFLEAGA
ncbi:hypothetical protein HKCCE2091_18495, partial [Rhodobacterales bacterium HKCCE2091]|nr:hypothetical protein [Rhodobacterales bacterium HKCCE2091]